jgi:hypothetical protein
VNRAIATAAARRIVVISALSLMLAACGSSTTSTTTTVKLGPASQYSSGWSRFRVAGPSLTAASASDMKDTLTEIPDSTGAVGYYAVPAGADNPFAAHAPLPTPPSVVVTVVQGSKSGYLQRVIATVQIGIGIGNVHEVTVGGATGIRAIVSPKALGAAANYPDPNAKGGILFVRNADVLWEVITIQNSAAAASAVLDSFQPVG